MKKKFNTVSLEPYSVHAKTQRIWTTMKMAHRWPNSFFKKRHIKEHKLQTQLLPFVVPGSLTLANIPAATQARCLGRHHPWFPLLLNLQINQAPNIFLPKKSQIHAHDHSPTISLAYCDTFLWFHYWWYFSSSNHNEKELPEWSIKNKIRSHQQLTPNTSGAPSPSEQRSPRWAVCPHGTQDNSFGHWETKVWLLFIFTCRKKKN